MITVLQSRDLDNIEYIADCGMWLAARNTRMSMCEQVIEKHWYRYTFRYRSSSVYFRAWLRSVTQPPVWIFCFGQGHLHIILYNITKKENIWEWHRPKCSHLIPVPTSMDVCVCVVCLAWEYLNSNFASYRIWAMRCLWHDCHFPRRTCHFHDTNYPPSWSWLRSDIEIADTN